MGLYGVSASCEVIARNAILKQIQASHGPDRNQKRCKYPRKCRVSIFLCVGHGRAPLVVGYDRQESQFRQPWGLNLTLPQTRKSEEGDGGWS